MNKKFFIGLSILLSIVFCSSLCFASNMVNEAEKGVQNVAGGAENAIKGAVEGAGNVTKNITNSAEKGMNNVVNNFKENGDNNTTKKDTNNENNNHQNVTRNDNYTATRTSTQGTNATFMGMNGTTWTWLIIGIAAIAIIAMVWYYAMQNKTNYKDKD